MARRRTSAQPRRERRQTAPGAGNASSGSSAPVARRPGLPAALVVLALVLAGSLAYSTSFPGVFVFDDKLAIVNNPNIKTLWPLTEAMSAPAEVAVSARPVVSLTLAINYALAPADARDVMQPGAPGAADESRFLRNVWGYHAMNLALHVLAALALFGVVRRTLTTERIRERLGDAASPLAFASALVWLVHPLLSDAVTYVVQRTELLLGCFYFSTLYCAIRAGDAGIGTARRRWWTAAAIAASALGMASKQTMVTVPLVVWLWDWTFRPQPKRRPLYAGLAATWIVLALLVASERWPHSIGINRGGWTPWTYLLTQTGVIAHYLRLALIPTGLVIDYDGWPMATSLLQVAPYAALMLVLFVLTVVAVLRRQPWGMVGGWCFAVLGPSSSVLPLATEIAAGRRMYLPLAALVVAAVVATYLLGGRALAALVGDAHRRRRLGTALAWLSVATVAITFGAMTSARNRDFWSDERIWQDTVEKRPTNPRARVNYGTDLFRAGRSAEAEVQFREAIRLKETSADAHANLGAILCSTGRIDEGIVHLERALAIDPETRQAYSNLAEAYGSQGRRALAARYFGLAVENAPDSPFLLSRLAWLLSTSPEDGVRNGARAVDLAERAVQLTSRQDLMSLDSLSAAFAEAGRFDEAIAVTREAIALASRSGQGAAADGLASRLPTLQARVKLRER